MMNVITIYTRPAGPGNLFLTTNVWTFLQKTGTGTRLRPALHSAALSGRKRQKYAYYRLWLRSRPAARGI